LSDALFFWEVDGKLTLEDRTAGLKSIVFQKELGTYAEKVDRMSALAGPVNKLTGSNVPTDVLDTALRWAKSDLTTELVREFPDLQGVVGALYARREGAPEELWRAIYDQYRPQSLEDRSPETPAGVVVSMTDSLDTVIGCFSVGLIPTGSADPLGLRRHTQGIIKTLLDHGLPFSLDSVLVSDARLEGERAKALKAFWEDRLRYILGRRGFAYDEISAVLATSYDSPSDVLARVEALHDVRHSPDLVAIAAAFKRIKNILKQSEKRGEATQGDVEGDDMEPAEDGLASTLRHLEPRVEVWARDGEYRKVLEEMANLRAPVDEFFDKILVMHRDPSVRTRRLVLLKHLFETFLQVADISEVVVSD
jgi:glycyl-tRNA synthetase beta chain